MSECGGLHEWASKRIDELTAENELLQRRAKDFEIIGDAALSRAYAAEAHLAAATALLGRVQKVYTPHPKLREDVNDFLAAQPAAPSLGHPGADEVFARLQAARQHAAPAECVSGYVGSKGECNDCGEHHQPAAPARTEPRWPCGCLWLGPGSHTCPTRTEAEQAVLDAMTEADVGYLEISAEHHSGWKEKLALAELARRGLK